MRIETWEPRLRYHSFGTFSILNLRHRSVQRATALLCYSTLQCAVLRHYEVRSPFAAGAVFTFCCPVSDAHVTWFNVC